MIGCHRVQGTPFDFQGADLYSFVVQPLGNLLDRFNVTNQVGPRKISDVVDLGETDDASEQTFRQCRRPTSNTLMDAPPMFD